MSVDQPGTAAVKRALPIILLTLFLDLLGFSILFPIFAELMLYYQAQDSGILAWAMGSLQSLLPGVSDERMAAFFGGFLLSSYALLQFLFSPFWGRLSDRLGRRPVLLLTTGLNCLGYAIWMVSGDFLLLLLGRMVNGIAAGNLSTLTAAAADTAPAAKRTRVMGAIGATFGAGFLLGPAIGGLAYAYLPDFDGAGFGLNRFSAIAGLALLLSAINLMLIYRYFPETRRISDHLNNLPLPGGGIVVLLAAYFVFMVSFTGMELALIFMVRDLLAFGPQAIAWLFICIASTSMLVQGGLVRRLSHRISDRCFAISGLCIFFIGMLLLALIGRVPHPSLAYIGGITVSLGFACVLPSISSWISKLAPDHQQGAAMGRLRSLGALARIVGPLACATMYFSLGAPTAFTILAVLLVLPLVMISWLVPAASSAPDMANTDPMRDIPLS
ncbi:MAG: MFS transporter [Planctomycetota bacterium]|nr:MAG: MFS transporter [Planctomycetota bacterium]